MAQIRKGFIAANAIDGTKLKLLNNDAIRAANADGTDAELMKLDSSNVLQFLKMPQVSSDPSVANDLARKSYVDGSVDTAKGELQDAVDAEQAAREAADSGLQSAIDTEVSDRQAAVAAEASAREAADSDLQDAIDTEKGRIDAILTAATADADSFAEIVSLINSVDTTNDQAFASYVLSNDAALASETSSRQSADSTLQSNIDAEASARASAVSSEASSRQAADTTLQSNIDAEAAARASAVSAEQSARESADAALQSAIDDLDIAELASVVITDAQDGDLWQFDLDSGKWVNVAPLSAAGSTSTGSSGEPVQLYNFTANNWDMYGGRSTGVVFQAQSGDVVAKYTMPLGKGNDTWTGDGTITGKIYEVTSSFRNGNGFNIAGNMALVASSTNTHTYSSLPGNSTDPRTVPDLEFTFSDVALTADTLYYIAAELPTESSGNFFSKAMSSGTPSVNGKVINGTSVYGDNGFVIDGTVYGPGENTLVTTVSVGVIKTNSDGMLDDSFLSYDVNFGDHKLQGVATPTSGTDAANKDYVDTEVASEASARQSADSTLQSNIDAEASARASAVSSEASTRQSADQTLQSNIDSEVSARQAAVSAEQSAREAGDASLQSQIDALDSGSSAGLAQEISDRQAADAVLQSAIDTEKDRIDAILTAATADADSFAEIVNLINSVDTENDNAFAAYVLSNDAALAQEVSDRQAAVSSEASTRAAADSTLQSNIDSEAATRQSADETLQDNIDAEAAARSAADSAEQSAREAADAGLASDLADETSARSAADVTLQGNIDAEQSAREAADSAEQSAREAGDATLQSNIDAETAAREAADSAESAARSAADTTLQGNIDSEAATRQAADDALDARVDALEGIQHRKEKFTLTSTDISNGYVDLGMECITDSEMVFVGALYLHSGDHYTVSSVGGVTRLTWAGDMVVGGTSELVAGDVVYVRYTK